MRYLPAFLAADELAQLRALAATATGWEPGRQGTGYEKLAIRGRAPYELLARACVALGGPSEDRWDAYVIRYRDGAHVPDHVDPAPPDRRHRRLNALVVAPDGGGVLHVGGDAVALAVGDAVMFEPDRERHRVSPVIGTRIVFSVGALF